MTKTMFVELIFESAYSELNGLKMYYEIDGQGKSLWSSMEVTQLFNPALG